MMRCVHCDTELVAPVRSEYWERQARLSHLALPEMLRLFFVCGLFSCRHQHETQEPLDSGRAQARLLGGCVRARLYSAGNADRSLSLVMVVRTGGVALAVGGPRAIVLPSSGAPRSDS